MKIKEFDLYSEPKTSKSPKSYQAQAKLDMSKPVQVLTLDLARQIGTYLRVDWNDVDVADLYKGMKIETEHSDTIDKTPSNKTIGDWVNIAKIAVDHLNEFPNYYDELKKMEKSLESKLREAIRKEIKQILRRK